MKLKKKKKSIKSLKSKLDTIFSLYIRRKDADNREFATCVTCFKKAHYSELQCGHYISRSYLATRYDDQNCAVQCLGCNVFKHGNMPAYTIYIQKKYGIEIINELVRRSRQIVKNFPYEAKIKEYEEKLKKLSTPSH